MFFRRSLAPILALDSLLRYDVNATGAGLRATDRSRLLGHEDMAVVGIDGDAMRIGINRKVIEPKVRSGIDNAHDRTGKHVAGREIVLVVAGVVPGLVDAASLGDYGAVDARSRRHRAGGARAHGSVSDYVLVGREGFAVVVSAAYQEIIPGSLGNAGGHAVQHGKTADHSRAHNAIAERGLGIDYVHVSNEKRA